MDKALLYKGKKGDKWIFGYPVIKNGKLLIIDKDSYEEVEIEQGTLCKNVYKDYYENDVFDLRGYKWTIQFEKAIFGYQLTRKDPKIKFTHYLPLSHLEEAKYVGNTIDSPELKY